MTQSTPAISHRNAFVQSRNPHNEPNLLSVAQTDLCSATRKDISAECAGLVGITSLGSAKDVPRAAAL